MFLLYTTGFESILTLTYFAFYLANEISDTFGPVDIFVPYDLIRNNLIYCSTLFMHFEILKNTLYTNNKIKGNSVKERWPRTRPPEPGVH